MIELSILMLVATAAAALTVVAIRQRPGDCYLCDDCRFNDPASCLKPERPQALVCTAYRTWEPAP